MAAFPILTESVTVLDINHGLLTYSDEIVQDFHLFPYRYKGSSVHLLHIPLHRHQLLFMN